MDVKADGVKVALTVNTSMLAAAALACVALYFQVQGMAEDVESNSNHPVSEARFMVLENEMGHIKDAVDENKETLEDIDEKQDEILKAVKP